MKNLTKILALCLLVAFASCGSPDNSVSRVKGVVMIGNKPYKLVYIELDNTWVKCVVPADSSVSIIPTNANYTSGKTQETTIVVQ